MLKQLEPGRAWDIRVTILKSSILLYVAKNACLKLSFQLYDYCFLSLQSAGGTSTTDPDTDDSDMCPSSGQEDSPDEEDEDEHRKCHKKAKNKPLACPDCDFRCATQHRLAVHRHKHDTMRFSCDICSASFKWKGNLTLHMKRHTNEGLHLCKVCKWKCVTPSDLERHMDTHRKSLDYKCSECGKSFKHKQNLTQHFKFHTGVGLHACKICKKTYSSSSLLKKHMDSHSDTLKYECPQCGKKMRSQVVYRYHMRLHSQKNVHVCPHCGKLYPHASALSKHLESHADGAQHECPKCGRRYKHQRAMARHCKVAHGGKNTHDCPECHKKFSSPSTLRYHLDTHATEAQYTCDVCGEEFIRIRALRYHMKLHTGVGMLRCPDCDKTFFTPSSLESHREVHSDQEVVCEICQNTYKNNRSLERHKQEIHQSSGTVHPCRQCNRSYKTRAGLQLHMRLHTGRKLHHCAKCGKGFIKPSELRKHQDVHSKQAQYKCDKCGKQYRHRYDLQAHMKVHSSSALKCGHCNKVFATKQQLESHVVVHTDDRPYTCRTCNKSFKYEYSLVKHWKRHLYPNSKANASVKAYSEYEIQDKDERDLEGLIGRDEVVSASASSTNSGSTPSTSGDPVKVTQQKDLASYTNSYPRIRNHSSDLLHKSSTQHSMNCEHCSAFRPVIIPQEVCETLHRLGKPVVKIKRLLGETELQSPNSNKNKIPSRNIESEPADKEIETSSPRRILQPAATSDGVLEKGRAPTDDSDPSILPLTSRTLRVPKSLHILKASDILQKVSKKGTKPIFINRKTRVLRSMGRLIFLHPKDDVCEISTTSGLKRSAGYSFQKSTSDSPTATPLPAKTMISSRNTSDYTSTIRPCSIRLVPLDCVPPSEEIVTKEAPQTLPSSPPEPGHELSSLTVVKDDPDEPPLQTSSCGLGRIAEVRSLAPAVSVNTLEEIEIKTEDLNDIVCDLDPDLPTEATPFNIDLKLPLEDPGYCALLRVKEEVHDDSDVSKGREDTLTFPDDVLELPGVIKVPSGYSIIGVVSVPSTDHESK